MKTLKDGMKKSVFSFLVLLFFFTNLLAYGYNDIGVYKDYKKIASGIKISKTIFVTKDSILRYNDFYLKKDKDIYYNYDVIFVDRVAGLTFLRIDIPGNSVSLQKVRQIQEDDPIYIQKENRFIKIGKYLKKIKGYGLLKSESKDLYAAMPLFVKHKKIIGIILGYFQKNQYIFLKSPILNFYKKNINTILKKGKPRLNIIVTELWKENGIKIIKSYNNKFKVGDVIYKIESSSIDNVLDFNISLFRYNLNNEIKFWIKRGESNKTVIIRRREKYERK